MRGIWQLRQAETEDALVLNLAEKLNIDALVAQFLFVRGYKDEQSVRTFLDKSLKNLISPDALSNIDKAVARLTQAVQQRQKILIHGDFDADGVTSTALLTLFLRDLGVDVTPFVPDRLSEGHGISKRAIAMAKENNFPLVITCDCGSSNLAEIQELTQANIDVIITDHHHVGNSEDAGIILVNPQLDDESTHQDLTGVGVVLMVCIAVRAHLRKLSFFSSTRAEPNLKSYLDIVALGTIADMAPLLGQNRILVHAGLEALKNSNRPGIIAMKEMAGIDHGNQVSSEDVGFRLAPRINAAARLGKAEDALALLLTPNQSQAYELARRLEGYNEKRKSEQERMFRACAVEAQKQVSEGRRILILQGQDFHPGLVGLVAQKVAELFARPTFVFGFDGELAKGSARSRNGINLLDVMSSCQELFVQFGGHIQAGGCSLLKEKLPEFIKKAHAYVQTLPDVAAAHLLIDGTLELEAISLKFVEQLREIGPFGRGLEEPTLAAKLPNNVSGECLAGKHLKIHLRSLSEPVEIIGFGKWQDWVQRPEGPLWIAFTPEISVWKGRKKLQLRLHDMKSFPFDAV